MTTQLEHLSRLYEFDSWRNAQKLEENLFVWQFRFYGGEIEGWTAHRIQHVELDGVPPANISVWRPAEAHSASLLAVDIYEAESRDAARQTLLRLLGEFEGPRLERRDAPGDVAFGAGPAALLFARANLVALVRNVERDLAPVAEIAAQFDQFIMARPVPVERGGPEISALRPVKPGVSAPGLPVPLIIEVREPDRQPAWFKLFSRSGDLRLEQRMPAYVPVGPGPHEIAVFAIGATGVATSGVLRLE